MAPLIDDGVYKIRNGEFSTFVADLINGIPAGPICAYKNRPDNMNDKWMIKNHGNGGNQISIECVSAPGCFADARQFSGSSLVGDKNFMLWTVVKVDGGKYYLQAPDGEYVWMMPNGADYVNIVLVHHTGKANTKWMFDPVEEKRRR